MEKWLRRSVELISGLALTGKRDPSVVPYRASKTDISKKEAPSLKRERPEKKGVSSSLIYAMLSELEAEPRANIHSLAVVRGGSVIAECSAPGYDVNIRHLAHSMSKSVTGIAIGLLVDEGLLDTEALLVELMPEYRAENEHPLFEKIKLRHLLEMSSFVKFSEAGSVTESEWCRAFFSSAVTAEPGSGFKYNSMNSYILARLVTRITGKSLSEYLAPRIFEPLGIDNYFWEMGPEGTEKGGWGLHLSVESWAKLGMLMLSRGVWGGKRLISERWISESLKTRKETGEALGAFNYGYHIWVGRESDEFLFSGMLGQNVWVCPKNGIVAVISSGNNELFQSSPALTIIRKYLSQDDLLSSPRLGGVSLLREKEARFFESRRWVKPLSERRGLRYLLGFSDSRPYDKRWDRIAGEFRMTENNYGLLPVFVRVMQNNFTGGIDSIRISGDGSAIRVSFVEGGVDYSFRAGLYGAVQSVLEVRGERYLVSASAEACCDSEGRELFKIELLMPEMPNSRQIRIYPEGECGVRILMTETPNERLTEPFIEMLGESNKKITLAYDFIKRRFGEDYLEKRIRSVFSPELVGVRWGMEDSEERLAEENRRLADEINIAASLAGLIMTFLGTEDEPPTRKNLLSGLLGLFMN